MKSGGQGLLNWLCVRVAGQQGVQVSARPRRPRGESHVWGGEVCDCLTCTSFSWGGSVEKEELGIQ